VWWGVNVSVCLCLSLSFFLCSRTLLIGANGAGKSSLLRILAGRHFHSPSKCQVFTGEVIYNICSCLYFSFDVSHRKFTFTCKMAVELTYREISSDFGAPSVSRHIAWKNRSSLGRALGLYYSLCVGVQCQCVPR